MSTDLNMLLEHLAGAAENDTVPQLFEDFTNPGPDSPFLPAQDDSADDGLGGFGGFGSGPGGIMDRVSRGVGGVPGAFQALSQTLAAMAGGFATPSYDNGWGNAMAAAAQVLPGALEGARASGRERELFDWIDEQLEDPFLDEDQRNILEAARGGNMPLAELQGYLARVRAAGGPKPLTPEQRRLDSQRRSRWAEISERGLAGIDISSRNTEGSLLNDALKRFHGEDDDAYRLRLRYVNEMNDLMREGAEPLTRVPFSTWLGSLPEGTVYDESGAPASNVIDHVANPASPAAPGSPLPPGDLLPLEADLYAETGITPLPSEEPFADRVFDDTMVGTGLETSGESAMVEAQGWVDVGRSIREFFGGTPDEGIRSRSAYEADPNARRSTVRREEALSGGGIMARLAAASEDPLEMLRAEGDFSGAETDPYRVGQKARNAFLDGLAPAAESLGRVPNQLIETLQRTRERYR